MEGKVQVQVQVQGRSHQRQVRSRNTSNHRMLTVSACRAGWWDTRKPADEE